MTDRPTSLSTCLLYTMLSLPTDVSYSFHADSFTTQSTLPSQTPRDLSRALTESWQRLIRCLTRKSSIFHICWRAVHMRPLAPHEAVSRGCQDAVPACPSSKASNVSYVFHVFMRSMTETQLQRSGGRDLLGALCSCHSQYDFLHGMGLALLRF